MIPLDAKAYEVLALAMRYFFTMMGVMIVWRSFSWLRKDRRRTHKRLKQLPDAGTIGVFTVEQGSDELPEGSIIPVPHEGVLGFLRTCDVVVPVEGVARTHADFTFVDGHGLYIHPRRGCEAQVDGVPLENRRDSRRFPMQHGSVLTLGDAVLRLGVFAGLDVKEARPAMYAPEDDWDAAPGGNACLPDMPQPVQPPYAPYNVAEPPYGQPPVQPPYGGQPLPGNQPWVNPWQGGDGDAQ